MSFIVGIILNVIMGLFVYKVWGFWLVVILILLFVVVFMFMVIFELVKMYWLLYFIV